MRSHERTGTKLRLILPETEQIDIYYVHAFVTDRA